MQPRGLRYLLQAARHHRVGVRAGDSAPAPRPRGVLCGLLGLLALALAMESPAALVAQSPGATASGEQAEALRSAAAPLPWGDTPVRYEAAGDALWVATVGIPERSLGSARFGRLAARRTQAGSRAHARAAAAVHAYVDAVLEAATAPAWRAAAVHAALEAQQHGVRLLADGGVVIRWRFAAEPLRAAWPGAELPWSP